MNFSESDKAQIAKKGIGLEQVEAQVNRIKNGMSYSNLVAAGNIGEGILSFSDNQIKDYITLYEKKQNNYSIVKFVPASGAATRMFKFMFQFLNNYDASSQSLEAYIEANNDIAIKTFLDNLERFPFYNELIAKSKENKPNFDNLNAGEQASILVKNVLGEDVLNYSFLPKGLLSFHQYKEKVVTAFEEHLFESTLYATSNNKANLHFTVSEKHHKYFDATLSKVKTNLEKETGVFFNVSYSYQKEETETLALTTNNDIYRNEDGSILFRPAGHGALLENLDELNNDIIFIKNIDNIVVEDKNVEVSKYKKLLAGVLVEIQEKAFEFLNLLDSGSVVAADILAITSFIVGKMNVTINEGFEDLTLAKKVDYLKDVINRPIRVCGMVKNEGEPGGGPFWVKDEKGTISLQIVEFAQIDIKNQSQADIVKNATHFNPCDLVCGVKNYKGEKFNLKEYVDPEAAFITMKTQNGTDIQALELPGLWNGSMAYWNSIFVEVPLETFNPVKTVNDLLKPAHQSS
ncbi:DUF4301 family protein [Algibacter mikhailovii]|uniref:DUF4301 family protein n=1 Tax=Algibacter mikhailovii TaxID=425498 RepID=UPI0024954010|nr:DUF4301 family protein [Algibacter mikhailovii]